MKRVVLPVPWTSCIVYKAGSPLSLLTPHTRISKGLSCPSASVAAWCGGNCPGFAHWYPLNLEHGRADTMISGSQGENKDGLEPMTSEEGSHSAGSAPLTSEVTCA